MSRCHMAFISEILRKIDATCINLPTLQPIKVDPVVAKRILSAGMTFFQPAHRRIGINSIGRFSAKVWNKSSWQRSFLVLRTLTIVTTPLES